MSGIKKVTTNHQFEIMVCYIEEHTELVTGLFNNSTTKHSLQEGWRELTNRLNAEGLPNRDVDGWKKVWADLKNKIKKKIRKTHIDINQTGGGSRSVYLTPFEERVVMLTGLMTSAIGVSGTSLGHDETIETTAVINMDLAVEDNINLTTEAAPRTQRRRQTQISKLFDEFKEQGRKNDEFQKSVINLMRESNLINEKRLKVEERARLQRELM